MKYLPILIFFLLSPFFSFGQKEIALFEPNTDKPIIKKLLANCNEKGVIGVAYNINIWSYFIAVDSLGEILYRGKCPNSKNHVLRPKGAIADNNRFVDFFSIPQSKKTHGVISDLSKKTSQPFTIQNTKPKERILGETFKDNAYFLISVDKSEQKLILNKFSIETLKFQSKSFDLPINTIKKLHNSAKSNSVSVVDEGALNDPIVVRSLVKLYPLSENKVALSLDGLVSSKPNFTELFIFDWETGEKQQFFYGKSTVFNANATANSLIYRKKLYYLSITQNHFYLSIHELGIKDTIQSYYYTAKDEIAIMKSNLLFNTDGYNFAHAFSKNNISKKEPAKVLSKLKRGIPFIYPKSYGFKDNFILLLGSGTRGVTSGFFSGGLINGSTSYDVSQYFITELDESNQISKAPLPNETHLEKRILAPWPIKTSFKNPKTSRLTVAYYSRDDNLIKIVEL